MELLTEQVKCLFPTTFRYYVAIVALVA